MNRRKLTIIYGILATAVLVVACAAGIVISGRSGQLHASGIGSGDSDGKTVAEQPMPVEVTRPVRRPLTRNLNIPATLRAYEKADLYAKISGYITQINNVDIGSRVRKGDVLLEIAVPEIVDELRQCEAVLEAKRAREKLDEVTTRRKEQLAAEKAISRQELDEALSQFAIAQADTKVAESNVARLNTLLKYATITAPFDGVITARNFDPGAFVRSAADGQTTPLFGLARTDKIRLVLKIPEPDAPFVHAGTKVEIYLPGLKSEIFRAAITRTAIALDSGTRTMRAEVDIDNTNGRLAHGMYARVAVKLEVKDNALIIPSKAIRARGRDTTVLVSRNGIAKSVSVKIGYDDGIWAEIVGGQLEDEDWVITSASSLVAPGVPVKPIRKTDSAALSAAL